MANQRNWWRNNWDKVIYIAVFLFPAIFALAQLKTELSAKIGEPKARIIAEEEIKDHAPSKKAFQDVREWMIEQRAEIKQLVKNVDWLVKRERERGK